MAGASRGKNKKRMPWMPALLLSLQITNRTTLEHTEPGQPPVIEELASASLRASLVLVPEGEPEASTLGVVQLQVEAQPENLPSMTPEQTLAFLREALKKML
jgi:hypothetical protein